MKKQELITAVSERMGTSKKAAGEVLDAVFGVIADALVDGEDVSVSGFGAFKLAEVGERTGIIQMGDRKGETYVTPAHKRVGFKPASSLKEAVK